MLGHGVATGLASALCSGASAFARWSALGTGGARPFGRVPSLRHVPCSSHTTAHVFVKVMRRASPCARLGVVGVGWGRCLGGRQNGTTRLVVPRLLVGRPFASPRRSSRRCAPPLTHNPLLPARSCTAPRPRTCVRFHFLLFRSMGRCPAQRVPMPPSLCPCSL